MGRPAGERLGDPAHEQQVRGAGEDEAAVPAGAVLVHRPLDREEQIGLALHLVQGQPGGAPHEVSGRQPGVLPGLRIVQREIGAVPEKRLGPHQSALAGLAGPHQHDDRRGGEGALQQTGSSSGQVVGIDHFMGDYRPSHGRLSKPKFPGSDKAQLIVRIWIFQLSEVPGTGNDSMRCAARR